MSKKLISIMLSLFVCISVASITAFATDENGKVYEAGLIEESMSQIYSLWVCLFGIR